MSKEHEEGAQAIFAGMTLSEFEFLLLQHGALLVGANFEGAGTTRCCLAGRLSDGSRLTSYGPTLDDAAKSFVKRLAEVSSNKPVARA